MIRTLVLAASLGGSLSQPVAGEQIQKLPGLWFTNDEGSISQLALLFAEGDLHPYFMYGVCQRSTGVLKLDLEVDPKYFGGAVTNGSYILVQFKSGDLADETSVETIKSNAAGPYGWSLEVNVGRRVFDILRQPDPVELSVGTRQKNVFQQHITYQLPEQNRLPVVAKFITACVGEQIPFPPRNPMPNRWPQDGPR